MPVNIRGKMYITVSERVEAAHEELEQISITTEFLPITDKVVCKATVITPKGTFQGTSAADPTKAIEKQSPYEVAETSAVGRALGFAGYGIVEGIATADEIKKATPPAEAAEKAIKVGSAWNCSDCGKQLEAAVNIYSMDHYGRPLCRDCQQAEGKKRREEAA